MRNANGCINCAVSGFLDGGGGGSTWLHTYPEHIHMCQKKAAHTQTPHMHPEAPKLDEPKGWGFRTFLVFFSGTDRFFGGVHFQGIVW